MSLKWANLVNESLEGGKASLSKSVSKTVKSVTDIAATPLAAAVSGWTPQFLLFVAFIIIFVIAIKREASQRNGTRFIAKQPVGTVVQVVEQPKSEPIVEPKFATLVEKVTDIWSQPADLGEPYLESETGSTYAEFQKAFMSRVEKPIIDKKMTKHRYFDPDVATEMTDMPDEIAEAFGSNSLVTDVQVDRDVFSGNSDVSDSEARQLAQEAFQIVPKSNPATVVDVLKEILSARSECERLGLALPETPVEQLESIKFWSLQSGPASIIAKKILSRI